jgi:hypothetical protein
MSTTTGTQQEGSGEPTAELPLSSVPNGHAYSEGSLLAASDTCRNCGAALAPDQRYCVECGERRGGPRFTVAQPAAAAGESAGPAAKRPHRLTASSWLTLIAGVATLLLALGVGVLIGKANNPASKTQSITVNAGGSSSSAPATGSTGASGGTSAAAGGGSGTSHARGSASHSGGNGALGTNRNLGSGNQQPGQACQAGTPGCVNGKQSGNLFGGG